MAGIAFVTGEIEGAVDVDRQIGIDLDEAAVVALVPVVATPRLAGHVLDLEALRRPAARHAPACGCGTPRWRGEHSDRAGRRDDELLAEGVVAIDQRDRLLAALLELARAPREVVLGCVGATAS